MACARLLVLLVCAAAFLAAGSGLAAAVSGRDAYFLGTGAATFVDTAGRLVIEDAVARPEIFEVTPGEVANRGVSPSPATRFWVRVRLPDLPDGTSWVLYLDETRINSVQLFVPESGISRKWDPRREVQPGHGFVRLPSFRLDAARVSGRTAFLQIDTRSSMRAMIHMATEHRFVSVYGGTAHLFGLLVGFAGALALYLVAIGASLRQADLLWLGASVGLFAIYVAADRAFLEATILPGAFTFSRVASLSATLALYGAWIGFTARYLGTAGHAPRLWTLARFATVLFAGLALVAGLEILLGTRVVRLWSAPAGLAGLGLCLALSVRALLAERRRATIYLLAWAPAIAGGGSRLLLDAAPGIGAHPLLVNAGYVGISASLLVFAVVASLEIQARERRLRRSAELSEERFRDFADAATDGFWETDGDGSITYAAAIPEGLNLERGRRLVRLLGSVSADEEALARLSRALAGRAAFRGIVVPVRSGAGQVRHLAFAAIPVLGTGAEGEGFRGVIGDVTEDVLEEHRRARRSRLVALGSFAGTMAHELNNLLHPIINLARRVTERPDLDDDARRQLELVQRSGLRAREIVAAALVSVRDRTTRVGTSPLDACLHGALEAIAPLVPATTSLIERIEEGAYPMADPGEVVQVVANLVSNAIHATAGAGRIVVSARVAPACGSVAIAVEDDGCGMDAQSLRQATLPFYTTKGDEGSGIGLAVVSSTVERWGGRVEIASRPGRGTRVEIRLSTAAANGGEVRNEAETAGACG